MEATNTTVRNIRAAVRNATKLAKETKSQNNDERNSELENQMDVEHDFELVFTGQWMLGTKNIFPICIKVNQGLYSHHHVALQVIPEEEEDLDDDLFLRLNIFRKRQYDFILSKITRFNYPTRNLLQRAFMVALDEYEDEDELYDESISSVDLLHCFNYLLEFHPPCLPYIKNYYEAILFSRLDNKCDPEGLFWHVIYKLEKKIVSVERLRRQQQTDDLTLKKQLIKINNIAEVLEYISKPIDIDFMAGMIDNKANIRQWMDTSRPLVIQAFWPKGQLKPCYTKINFVLHLMVKLKKVNPEISHILCLTAIMNLLATTMSVYDQQPGTLDYQHIGENGSTLANAFVETILATALNLQDILEFSLNLPEWLKYILFRRLLERCTKNVYSSLQPAIALLRNLFEMKTHYPSEQERNSIILSDILNMQPTKATENVLPGTSKNQGECELSEKRNAKSSKTMATTDDGKNYRRLKKDQRKRKIPTKNFIPDHFHIVCSVLVVHFIMSHLRFSRRIRDDLRAVKHDYNGKKKREQKVIVPINFTGETEDIKEFQHLYKKYICL